MHGAFVSNRRCRYQGRSLENCQASSGDAGMSHATYSRPDPKIRPAVQDSQGRRPDGSPNDNDRVEIGPTALAFEQWRALGLQPPNLERLRAFRLQRLCEQLQANDYAGILLFDPLNIRYATDTTNMQLWVAHNPARACWVSADGYVILWDFHNCRHLSAHLPLVNEVRTAPPAPCRRAIQCDPRPSADWRPPAREPPRPPPRQTAHFAPA